MEQQISDGVLADLVVRENFLSRDELAACLEAQRLSPNPRPLSQVMLEMQLITASQLERILNTHRTAAVAVTAETPRPISNPPSSHITTIGNAAPASLAELFGRLAVERAYVSPAQVEECLAEQKALEMQGQKMRVGQLMIKKRYITTDQFLEILKLQEKYILACPSCESKYFAGDLGTPSPGGLLMCKKCGTLLPSPSVVQEVNRTPTSSTPRTGTRITRPLSDPTGATIKVPAARPTQVEKNKSTAEVPTFGKYRLLDTVGKGGMGVVYRALDVQLHRVVALKMLKETDADGHAVQRFLREAKTAAQLNHPGIVTIHEVGTSNEIHYFTMEFIEGESLDRLLGQKRVSRDEALSLIERVARAVDYAHSQGVVHRDLKPGNIMVDRSGSPHVTDFGLAKQLGPVTSTTQDGTAVGTPFYMSPEQVRGEIDQIEARSDVYALGVMLYEILAGELPFVGSTTQEVYQKILTEEARRPREVRPDVPVDLEVITLKAMEKEKSLRYASAGEMADDLRRYLDGEPIVARPISVVTRVAKRVRRNKLTAAAVLLAVAAGTGGFFFWRKWSVEHAQALQEKSAKERRERAEPFYRAADQSSQQALTLLFQPKSSAAEIRKLLETAAENLGKSVQEDPAYADAFYLRGKVYHLLGQFDEAERDYGEAIRIDPARPQFQLDLGKLNLVKYELARGRPLVMVGVTGEPLLFSAQESSLAEATRASMREAFGKFVAASATGTDSSLAAAGIALADAQWDVAIDRACEVLRDEPKNEVALRLRGLAYYNARKMREAFEDFDQALQYRSKSKLAEAGDLQGLTIFSKGELDWALGAHTRAIEAAPSSELYINRGVLRMTLGNLKGARDDFEAGLKARPDSAEAQLRKIGLALAQRETDKLLEQLTQIIRSNPNLAEAYRFRAAVLLAAGDPTGAFKDADKAVEKAPDDPASRYVRGRAHLALGRYDDAMRDANRAITTVKSFYHAYELQASAKIESRDFLGARGDINRAIDLRPDYARSYVASGRIRANQNEPADKVFADFDRAAKLDPKLVEAKLWRILCQAQLHERDAKNAKPADRNQMLRTALDDYNNAAQTFPKSPEVFDERGRFLRRYGINEQALADFQHAIELGSARQSELEGFVRELKRVLEAPKDWFALFTKADELVRGLNYTEAKKYFEAGVKVLPDRMPEGQRNFMLICLYNYACVLAVESKKLNGAEKNAMVDQALAWLEKAMAMGCGDIRCSDNCPVKPAHKTNLEHMRYDEDFESIRDDPRFKKIARLSDE